MRGIRRRRTNKSSSGKVSRRQKNRMDISLASTHPLIQKNWDKSKTLRQNYENLGLVATLNGVAGGTGNEAIQSLLEKKRLESLKNNVEFRNINDVNVNSDKEQDTLNPIIKIDQKALQIGVKIDNKLMAEKPKLGSTAASVITAFEQEALNYVPVIKYSSQQESLVFNALYKKYGNDYDAMQRDIKLNKYQLSAGQLKKKMSRPIK